MPPAGTVKPKRHLKTKPVLIVIGVLLLINILWFIAWLIPNDTGKAEKVASVSGEAITREEWLASMEEQHGREALLELVNEKVMATAAKDYGIEVSDKEIDLELGELKLKTYPSSDHQLSTSNNMATLDADNITFPLLLRKWKQGDYFYPLGMQKKKKLSKFFIDQKMSLTDKEKVWVIESNKKIIWVIGKRIDDRFKITGKTKNILEVTIS